MPKSIATQPELIQSGEAPRALPENQIINGDSIALLHQWPAGQVDLVFADPPFNIGYVYDNYTDDMPNPEYRQWSRDWMAACVRTLKPTGSFYIAIGAEFVADLRVIGRELGLHLRNWIIWHYSFGQSCKAMFARSHTHILYFTRDAKVFTFNDQVLRFPSARHTEYQDLRASPAGRLPNDVWDEFPRVCGTFKERAGFHGCQMPEGLLMRIIMASSLPGELVLDPFNGSGTTAAAAKRLGRRFIGIDLSPEYVAHTQARLANIEDETRKPRPTDAAADWPRFHVDMLMQIYRETKVRADYLVENEVVLRVIAGSLAARCGAAYEPAEIAEKLLQLRAGNELPKMLNDRDFSPRQHVNSAGKRYVRKVIRKRSRRNSSDDTDLFKAAS